MSELLIEFTKDTIDNYLKEVAKEYRRQGGKNIPAEMTIIGGASVLINYGFRNMTTDIDAIIYAASTMKSAINNIGDRHKLPRGWLNGDFVKTESYTDNLIKYSVFYKSYYGVLTVRTIAAEYLIAMKLRAGRQYKNDLSDILGILIEHEKRGKPIEMVDIRRAVTDLYGDWDALPVTSKLFISNIMADGNYKELYEQIKVDEINNKDLLVRINHSYPGMVKETSINALIDSQQEKRGKASIIAYLLNHRENKEKNSMSKNELDL